MFHWLRQLFHKEQTSRTEKIISGAVAFAYIFILGYAGSSKNMAFYESLAKPSLTPPNWVFPVVWTILFSLIGLSGYYVWNHFEKDLYRKIFAALYFINGILVYMWSYVFFGNNNINGALYVIIGMIILIESMILVSFRTNRKAAYLLLPYFMWVLFATYLNASIIALNS